MFLKADCQPEGTRRPRHDYFGVLALNSPLRAAATTLEPGPIAVGPARCGAGYFDPTPSLHRYAFDQRITW